MKYIATYLIFFADVPKYLKHLQQMKYFNYSNNAQPIRSIFFTSK